MSTFAMIKIAMTRLWVLWSLGGAGEGGKIRTGQAYDRGQNRVGDRVSLFFFREKWANLEDGVAKNKKTNFISYVFVGLDQRSITPR